MKTTNQKITTFLWFANQAEEAAHFYIDLFKNGRILSVTRYGKSGLGAENDVMVLSFELFGQEFVALNGNPNFQFNETVSLYVKCYEQAEIDQYWNAILQNGGQPLACGWIKDRYGLAWQITPPELPQMLQDPDPEKAARVMAAMQQMVKIDLGKIREAYHG